MSRTSHNYPVNRVKARHNNAIPYKRQRWSVVKEIEVGDVDIIIEHRK
jgi:hypothetical protein